MPTTDDVLCPKCGSQTWDNRATKKNPKAPDYKCRDKSCDGCVWPPKNGAAPVAPRPVATSGKEPYSSGPYISAIDAPAPPYRSPTPIVMTGNGLQITDRLDYVFALYSACLDHVLAVEVPKLEQAKIGASPESVSAMTSTLLIQASKT